MRKSLLLLILCAAWATSATIQAQLIQNRFLPAHGERGRLGEAQALPLVKIGSRTLRLAPGGVIFDQNNRTIIHAHLPAGAEILYTRDQERERLARAGKR